MLRFCQFCSIEYCSKVKKVKKSTPISPQKTKVRDVNTAKDHVLSRTKTELLSSPSRKSSYSASSLHELPSSSSALKLHTSRSSEHLKPSLPVTLSYVSVHGGDDQSLMLNATGPESTICKTSVQSPSFYNGDVPSLRVERSRTSLTQNSLRSNRLRRHEILDSPNKDRSHHASDTVYQLSQNTPDLILAFSPNEKSFLLPKPTAPNLDYLNGSRGVNGISGSSSASLSMTSPRLSVDHEVEHQKESLPSDYLIHQMKR